MKTRHTGAVTGGHLGCAIFHPIWSLDLAYTERKQARQAMFRNVGCYLAFEQQTQPRYRARSGNRTRDTLVGDKCSHLCAMSSPPLNNNVSLKESHTLCSKLLYTNQSFHNCPNCERLQSSKTVEKFVLLLSR